MTSERARDQNACFGCPHGALDLFPYLTLLRVEIARFTLRLSPETRLCSSNPRTGFHRHGRVLPATLLLEPGLSSPPIRIGFTRLVWAWRPSGLQKNFTRV